MAHRQCALPAGDHGRHQRRTHPQGGGHVLRPDREDGRFYPEHHRLLHEVQAGPHHGGATHGQPGGILLQRPAGNHAAGHPGPARPHQQQEPIRREHHHEEEFPRRAANHRWGERPHRPAWAAHQDSAGGRGGRLPAQRRQGGRSSQAGREAAGDLLGLQDGADQHPHQQVHQPYSGRIRAFDPGRVGAALPPLRPLSGPCLGQCGLRRRELAGGRRTVPLRGMRLRRQRVQLEEAEHPGSVGGSPPRTESARLPHEHTGQHPVRLAGHRPALHRSRRGRQAGRLPEDEGMGQHRPGPALGGKGRHGGANAAPPAPGVLRGRGAGRRDLPDRRRGHPGQPLRGRGGGLGHRQGKLGHPLPKNLRRPQARADMGRPGRVPGPGLAEEGRNRALPAGNLHGQRRTLPGRGAAVLQGPGRPAYLAHQGPRRHGCALHPQPHAEQPRRGGPVHHRC